MNRRVAFLALALTLANSAAVQGAIKPDEARAIAKDAYIYGYPLVESYRILYSYFVDRGNPEFAEDGGESVTGGDRDA